MELRFFIRTGAAVSLSCSAMVGRYRQTTGARKCCSSSVTAIALLAHDRRGHGRFTQVSDGHDMDHYANDLAALTAHFDLEKAIHVGHSSGGGEVVRYIARHGESRVVKAAIISAVPPLMVRTPANPKGQPKKIFDDFQLALAANPLATTTRRASSPRRRSRIGGGRA